MPNQNQQKFNHMALWETLKCSFITNQVFLMTQFPHSTFYLKQSKTTIAEDQPHRHLRSNLLPAIPAPPCPGKSAECQAAAGCFVSTWGRTEWNSLGQGSPGQWCGWSGWFCFISDQLQWIWHDDLFVWWEAPYRWRHACLSKLESFLIEERNAGRYHPLISEGLGSWHVTIDLPALLNLEWTQCGSITAFALTNLCHTSDPLCQKVVIK